MILKAGTYRWVEAPDLSLPFNHNINASVDLGELGTVAVRNIYNDYTSSNEVATGLSIIVEFEGDYAPVPIYAVSTIEIDGGVGTGLVWFDGDDSFGDGIHYITLVTEVNVEDTFGIWFIANTNYSEVNGEPEETTVKQFTRLYKGDVVASGTTRQLRKLTTDEPQAISMIGTWRLKDSPIEYPFSEGEHFVNISFNSNGELFTGITFTSTEWNNIARITYHREDTTVVDVYLDHKWQSRAYQVIKINADPSDNTFINWLLSTATRATEEALGTWYFDSTITSISYHWSYNLLFTLGSDTTLYTRMQGVNAGDMYHYIYVDDANNDSVDVVKLYDTETDTWYNQNYRTIHVLFVGVGDIWSSWLKANATKVS